MKFENTEVWGFQNAVLGMRLPMCKDLDEAKAKSDSHYETGKNFVCNFRIGKDDLKILKNLINADNNGSGQPNSKVLRMIHVQVCITAPQYWWSEADTYKVGTVANSTSKMHRLLSYPITTECFEENSLIFETMLHDLEIQRLKAIETKEKTHWKKLLVNLPESWLQTRMFDCNYATLRNMYYWRKNHKLSEWHDFCDWVKSLPYADELIVK